MIDVATPLLWLAFAAAVATSLSLRLARTASILTAVALVIPTAILGRALWRLDLSVTYVADHARGGTSAPYRLAGLWGGASGSFLLLTAMISIAVAGVLWFGDEDLARAGSRWGGATVAVLTVGVLGLADPFDRLEIPGIDGGGLQPILEHPAMLYHPPLLYIGLVSTIVGFLLAVTRESDASLARPRLRRALGVSLALLTIGLATGANWAYVELGWGGYWGWDPVENGVLVPWILTVGALHATRQPGHERTVRALAGAPWVLVLVGTAVTRAGVGESVHAFADDERLKWMLLGLITATTAVLARSVAATPPRRRPLRPLVATNVGLALFGAFAVLLGLLYPIPARGAPTVSGHFFATILGPVALVALAGAGAALSKRGWQVPAIGAAAGLFLGVVFGARGLFALGAAAGVGGVLGGLVFGLAKREPAGWAMRLGHVGFALLLIGVAGSTQADRTELTLALGETVDVGGYTFEHLDVQVVDGPAANSSAVQATIAIRDGSHDVAVLEPSLVSFTDRRVILAETGLRSRPLRDIQVVLRHAADSGLARYEISVTPLTVWVWWGSALLAASGFAAAARTRPRSSRRRVTADSTYVSGT